MKGERADELYVGYLPEAPAGIAAFVRRRVLAILVLGVSLAALLAASQGAFARAAFEYGTTRPFEGWIEERPYPSLLRQRPGDGSLSRYLLTVFGKRGADALVAGLEGRRVRLEGTLVYREGATMLEVAAGSLTVLDGPGRRQAATDPPPPSEEATLAGEIVDSKCFFGVMKPGHLKPHRACATRCISGGVPPVLLVRDADGDATYYLLTSADGGPVGPDVVERGLVAEPVRVRGTLVRDGDWLWLRADPESFERL